MQHNNVKSGDVGEKLYVTIDGLSDLQDVDAGLSFATITNKDESYQLDISIPDANDLVIEVDLGTDPADWLPANPTPGMWEITYKLILSNPARELTWPSNGHDLLRVEGSNAYCQTSDILTGDVTVDEEVVRLHVEQAAEEIDGAIGHLYATPVVSTQAYVKSYLKQVNVKLATGRYFAAMARGGDESGNAYAMSLIKEGRDMLERIVSGQVRLGDSTPVPDADGDSSRAPTLVSTDSGSLVKGFYDYLQDPTFPTSWPQQEWYDA